jgi:outer membrane autotransporter protein
VRSPLPPAWAQYSGSVAGLISAALLFVPGAAAQVRCDRDAVFDQVTAALTRAATAVQTTTAQDTVAVRISPEACRNLESAPKVIAIQPGITVVATAGFAGAIAGRLDSARGQAGAVGTVTTATALLPDGLMGLGARAKAHPPAPTPASPLTVYAMGTVLGGSRADAPNLFGFDYNAGSGTIGVEYSVSRNLILGIAANYTGTSADVTGGATVDVRAIQGAVYLSYATRQWFFDLLAAYGSHDLDLTRPGLGEKVLGSTGGGVLALAARAGYLFDFGGLRAGPIAGLTYVHSRVDGYTETGDPQLTLTVSALTVDSLTGNIGIRFLAPFRAGGNLFVPYLNVTLEHQFGDLDHVLTANLAAAPPAAQPIFSTFPAFDARDFGKIDAGVTLELGPELSTSISGASTFARDEGYDFRLSAGLNYRF